MYKSPSVMIMNGPSIGVGATNSYFGQFQNNYCRGGSNIGRKVSPENHMHGFSTSKL